MTSGQYAYLILRKLQAYTSCDDSHHRAYLYNFYGDILNDPSVIITGENYQEFCDLMDYEMDYAARKNYTTPQEVYEDENFDNNYVLLQNSFAAIGVQLEMTKNSDGPTTLIFTLPNGKVKILDDLQGTWKDQLHFHCRLRVTDSYFKQISPYYAFEMETPLDLSVVGTRSAGYNTYWDYDEDTKTIEISGDGTLANFLLWQELNITDISTLILGAGVYRLLQGAFNASNLTIVDFHGSEDTIFIEPMCAASKQITIYSDNNDLRNYNWSSYGTTVEWHSLSEWNE